MSRSSSRAIHRPMGEVVEAAMKEILPERAAVAEGDPRARKQAAELIGVGPRARRPSIPIQ